LVTARYALFRRRYPRLYTRRILGAAPVPPTPA